MFLYRGGLRAAETGMGPCAEGSTSNCVPHLKAADMIAALTKRGFECQSSRGCELEIGETVFIVRVGIEEGGISRLTATVVTRVDTELSSGAKALLRWVGGVPFAHDRQGAAEVDAWLTKQVTERKTVHATIAGYEYQLDNSSGIASGSSLSLDITEKLTW